MAWAFSDQDNGSLDWSGGSIAAGAVAVSDNDLIVVAVGVQNDTSVWCTGVTDTEGNTYTVRSAIIAGANTTLVMAYCIGASANASNVVTATFNNATECTKTIMVSVHSPDAGETVTLDVAMNKYGDWEASPWETGTDDTTGTDELCVVGCQAGSDTTYTNHEIPGGTAATALTSPGYGAGGWYRILTATASGLYAEVDPSGDQYYCIEMLCFKSEETSSSSSSSQSTSVSSSSSSESTSISSSSSSESVSVSSSSSSESTSISSSSSSSSESESISSSSSSESTSISSSSSSESTSVSSSSSSQSLSQEGWTWGEETPDPETAVEWSVWRIKETVNDARDSGNWGELQLGSGEEFVSDVKDMGSVLTRYLILTYDDYASGSGSGTLYWRGQATSFNYNDDEVSGPAWEEYTGPANKSWRYIQVMAEG